MEPTRHVTRRQGALDRFERATELPMLLLALAIIPLLLAPAIFELNDTAEAAIVAADCFIWSAFAVEYGVRLVLTEQRGRSCVASGQTRSSSLIAA